MIALLLAWVVAAPAQGTEPATSAGLPNPFYAMDTYTKRPYPQNDIPPAAQLDMLAELGYDGIAWTDEPPEQVAALLREADARGLKVFAIYFGAQVSPDGGLDLPPRLDPVMDVLRGRDTLIWLHLGGRGPDIATLEPDHPVIERLRALADGASARGLRIALYPHVGDWTERTLDALRVAELVDRDNLGLTYNLCHSLATGDEGHVTDVLERAAPRLFTVTINGADAGVGRPDWSRLIQTLDRGSFDVGAVLRTLRTVGFDGPVGVQGYGLAGDRRDNLARTMAAWRRISDAAAR